MSENGSTNGAPDSEPAAADAVVEKRRGISPIWVIPIIVAVVAAGLAYQAIENRGSKIVILFDSAEGLTPGKSVVKYRDVEVGTVDEIRIRDKNQVEIYCTVVKRVHVREDMQWWVVRPRIGGSGISGLETLVSGAYLTFRAGVSEKRKSEFVGLEEPPIPAADVPGLQFVLHAEHLGGVDTGSPIFYRNIHVGDVLHYALAKDGRTVEIKVAIQKDHADRVTSASRFWNAGGVDVSVGPAGLDVKTESIEAILAGGIAFDSPTGGKPAAPGDSFWLHESRADVALSRSTHGGLRLMLESGSLGSVAAGNPVYYREMPVGAVVSFELSKDRSRVRIKVNVERRYASLVRHNSVFWNSSGISADLGLTGLHVHAESLKSLLAGGISFATPPKPGHTVSEGSVFRLHPEAKSDWQKWETDYTPKKGDPPEKHSGIGRFFHYEKKTEEQAKQDDPTPEPSEDEQKHGFLHRLFHHGD